MKKSIPSKAQARLLARLWGEDGTLMAATDGSDIEATVNACINRGWLAPIAGQGGKYPNGTPFAQYEVVAEGIKALEDYLRETRLKSGSSGEVAAI